MKIHTLKAGEPTFSDLRSGVRTFDVRRNDQDFHVGDLLMICQYINDNFTGYDIQRKISYIGTDSEGLKDGYVLLGLTEYSQKVDSSTVPMKVLRESPDFLNRTMSGDCPHCGNHITKDKSPDSCVSCGCPVLWGESKFF